MISLTRKENQRSHVLMPALISACAIPISMLFWFVNVIYSTFYLDSENHFEGTSKNKLIINSSSSLCYCFVSIVLKNITFLLEHLVVSPWRWLTAVVIPIFMAFWGLRRKSVDVSGAVLGNAILLQFFNVRKLRIPCDLNIKYVCLYIIGNKRKYRVH